MRSVSGMSGGVGLAEAECGSSSSPIALLGLLYGDETDASGLPKAVSLGQRFLDRFAAVNGSVSCAEISPRKGAAFYCIRSMCTAPKLLTEVLETAPTAADGESSAATAQANRLILRHFGACDFHCARGVMEQLADVIEVDEQTLRALTGFVGGTVLRGMTCGALVAGVVAIGLRFGEIEDSYLRVLNLTRLFMFNQARAMENGVNKSNRAMNTGYLLVLRFEQEFGSGNCRQLCGVDFSTAAGVEAFIAGDALDNCRRMQEFVVRNLREILDDASPHTLPVKVWDRGRK